jgi:hypothetical protein
MRVEGLADNEIAGLFRHAADELDETTMTKDGEVDPAAQRETSLLRRVHAASREPICACPLMQRPQQTGACPRASALD